MADKNNPFSNPTEKTNSNPTLIYIEPLRDITEETNLVEEAKKLGGVEILVYENEEKRH
jgi:hypothetical protein